MGEIKIGDKVLVEMNVVGWDKITGDYQMRPKEDTRTFWASGRFLHPIAGTCDKTYEDGLNEAWETARKIICNTDYGGFSPSQLEEIFGCPDFDDVFHDYTQQEAAAKITEWESRQKIHVGDILVDRIDGQGKAVVTYMDEGKIYVVWDDGSCGECKGDEFTKTGRTIDIAGLLAQIGGTE